MIAKAKRLPASDDADRGPVMDRLLMESETKLRIVGLARFLQADPYPLRSKTL